ncbi:MAG TPA: hypothetical protein PKW80_00530 [Bacteroidales bacterium]|nr:hypothetical protein [Bacteroidales bacterium]
MKKLLLYISFVIFTIIRISAQNGLTYDNNAYLNADEQPYIIAEQVNEGNPGPDQIWDFSALKQSGELTSYMYSAKDIEGCVSFPEANIVLREKNTNYFFKVSPSGMDEYGNSNENFSVVYDKPIVKFPFPFTYGSSCSGVYSGTVLKKNNSYPISGTYSTLADGFGSLILPGNIKIDNVLRVRFVRKRDNSATESVTYRWYAQNSDPVVRYPLLTITFHKKGTSSKAHIVAYYANAYQLANNQANINPSEISGEYTSPDAGIYDVKISPNPFTEKAQIEYRVPELSRIRIEAFDNTGRIVEKLTEAEQDAGPYSVFFKGSGQFVYYIRFIANDKLICVKKIIQMK